MADRYFSDEPIYLGPRDSRRTGGAPLDPCDGATPGVQVTLFDGGGDEFPAVVEQVERADVELTTLSCEQVDRELPFELTLGVALPKGDRQKWLVEKAVELGVTQIVPLRTSAEWPSRSIKPFGGCGGPSSRHRNNAAATACSRSTSRNPGQST